MDDSEVTSSLRVLIEVKSHWSLRSQVHAKCREMQAAQVAYLRSHGWQAEQLILQAFQFHKMTQDFHRKGMTLMDSYKDNHNHPVTDGVGEPKDKRSTYAGVYTSM